MEDSHKESTVVNLASVQKARLENLRRIGAAINHIAIATKDLKKFSDLEGVEQTIKALFSLQHCLSEQLESSKILKKICLWACVT